VSLADCAAFGRPSHRFAKRSSVQHGENENTVALQALGRLQARFLAGKGSGVVAGKGSGVVAGKGSGVVAQILECSLAPPWLWTPGPGQLHGMPRCMSDVIKRLKADRSGPTSMLRWDLPVALYKHGVWLSPAPGKHHRSLSADVCGCSGNLISTSAVGFLFDPNDGRALRVIQGLPHDAFTSDVNTLKQCQHRPNSEASSAMEHAHARMNRTMDAFADAGFLCWESAADRRHALRKQRAFAALMRGREGSGTGSSCGHRAGLLALYNQFHFRATDHAQQLGRPSSMLDALVAIFYVNASEYAGLRRPNVSAEIIEEAREAALRAYHTAKYVQTRLKAHVDRPLPVLQARHPCTSGEGRQSQMAQRPRLADGDDFFLSLPPADPPRARAPGLGAHRSPLVWDSRQNLTCKCRHNTRLMRRTSRPAMAIFDEQAAKVHATRERNPEAGAMNKARCREMLRDPYHVFRAMWSATAWKAMKSGQTPCWAAPRTMGGEPTTRKRFFDDALQGTHCGANWLQDSRPVRERELRRLQREMRRTANTSASAAAIIGLDGDIRQRCRRKYVRAHPRAAPSPRYVEVCLASRLNVLALHGTMPYNLCRNLEWLACAAQGRLLAQRPGRGRFVFATRPRDLDLLLSPFGMCVGHVPARGLSLPGGFGYTARDVFGFETCALSEMCANGAELFSGSKDTFMCKFSREGFERLRNYTSSPLIGGYEPLVCAADRYTIL